MYLRSDERGSQMSNRLALRVALFGGFALALLVALFFRLWFLQMLNGEEYLAEANSNRIREYRVNAPRGEVLDRHGEVLVANRTSLALQVNPRKLPVEDGERRRQLAELGELTQTSLARVRQLIREGSEEAPGAPVTLRRDVGQYVVYYLQENQARFPGVSVRRVFVRSYPQGSLAAHVLGNVGEIDEDGLKEARYRGLQPGDEVGQDGLEYEYDRFLRGTPGLTRVQVDARGLPTRGAQLASKPSVPGDNLRLSIDAGVQAAGEAEQAAQGRGGFVAMDVHSGEVIALGSNPSFDPTVLTKPMTQAQVDDLYNDPVEAPMTNRVLTGLYPTGSTFKIVPALAALDSGLITPQTTISDNGFIMVGTQRFQNAGATPHGSVDLRRAVEVSSDVYFYLLGWKMWEGNDLQRWSRMLGVGRPTGIDLPGDYPGLVPSSKWRDDLYAAGETDRPWSAGDNIQLAIGQGDLQMSPLQLAVAYATLATGGTVPTPHLGMQIDDPAGRVLRELETQPRRSIRIDPAHRRALLEGLHGAAQGGEGTSTSVFGGFPVPIAGKTGTAERYGQADQSWYAALAPYPNPRIVTVATVEQGGFGADSAAPVALKILEAYFGKKSSGEAQLGGSGVE